MQPNSANEEGGKSKKPKNLSFPNASIGINSFGMNLNMLRMARRVAHMDVGYNPDVLNVPKALDPRQKHSEMTAKKDGS
ncbi:MAG: hypothetical protein COA54_12990 [Thiotrichaceae bacterium]|nr:MAG: hypothetical protein COA54_12990 [Thiotrichaceae bacterium]